MKWKTSALAFLLVCTPLAHADGDKPESDAAAQINSPMKWNTDPAHWDGLIKEQSTSPNLRIGKSDYVISGPLIDGIRKRRYSSDRSLGRKILGLPVVRLFVPQLMPYPPGGGKYFRWGESNKPWTAIAHAGGGAGADNPINHEPQATLISIGR